MGCAVLPLGTVHHPISVLEQVCMMDRCAVVRALDWPSPRSLATPRWATCLLALQAGSFQPRPIRGRSNAATARQSAALSSLPRFVLSGARAGSNEALHPRSCQVAATLLVHLSSEPSQAVGSKRVFQTHTHRHPLKALPAGSTHRTIRTSRPNSALGSSKTCARTERWVGGVFPQGSRHPQLLPYLIYVLDGGGAEVQYEGVIKSASLRFQKLCDYTLRENAKGQHCVCSSPCLSPGSSKTFKRCMNRSVQRWVTHECCEIQHVLRKNE